MPRNSNGTYQLPLGNPVTSGTVISASWANTTIPDLATAISGTLPTDGSAPLTGSLKIADGLVSFPGVAFNAESGTGMYRKGLFMMGLSINGADALVLNNTGASVTGNLTIAGTTNAAGAVTLGSTLSVTGALTLNNNLTVSGNTTLTGTTAHTGTSSFTGAINGSSATFTGNVTAATLTGNGAAITAIPNSSLVNNSITLGSTVVALGGSTTTLNNLTLSGTPNAPTAAATTNTTQIATTAMVQAAITYVVPRGIITMWSGTIAAIPAGWALCNGLNGTPNLQDRFIVGAGSGYGVGAIGGSVNPYYETTTNGWHGHGMDVAGWHSHGGVTDWHTLTIDQIPAHSHGTVVGGGNNQIGPQSFPNQGFYPFSNHSATTWTGGGAGHQHGVYGDGNHQHGIYGDGNHLHGVTIDTRSPYYALAYIMKL